MAGGLQNRTESKDLCLGLIWKNFDERSNLECFDFPFSNPPLQICLLIIFVNIIK